MNQQKERRSTAAVVVGWARDLFPEDSGMLVLLGRLQTAEGDTFDVVLGEVKVYGEMLSPGFTAAVEGYVAETLQQIREAEEKLAAAV